MLIYKNMLLNEVAETPTLNLTNLQSGMFTITTKLDLDGSLDDRSHLVTKPTKWLCAQRRLRSAWASAQSDQSLRCALNG